MISKDVSRLLQRKFGKLKIGHVGTLDPSADGVLVVVLGRATKLQDALLALPKTYEFRISWGFETDTLDLDGQVVATVDEEKTITSQMINDRLSRFRGDIIQVPPLYSAIKVDGRPLYEYARKGIDLGSKLQELARSITIHEFELMDANDTFRVTCSKGTYVRCLARDLAVDLGTLGTCTRISRTAACGFSLEEAVDVDTLEAATSIDQLITPIAALALKLSKDHQTKPSIAPPLASFLKIGSEKPCLDGSIC